MIHLQVCLSASQASSHSFSPPLPRWAKAPNLLRLQRHCLFSHMTLLPRGVCLPLWIPTKQALMASLCITWVNYILLRKICMLCNTIHDVKWDRTQLSHHSSPHERHGCLCIHLLNYVALNVLNVCQTSVFHHKLALNKCEKKDTGSLLWCHTKHDTL